MLLDGLAQGLTLSRVEPIEVSNIARDWCIKVLIPLGQMEISVGKGEKR